jgi:hypothetical protein
LDQAIQTLVDKLKELDPQFLDQMGDVAEPVIGQWLGGGRKLGKLREELNARKPADKPADKPANIWSRNIDYLLGDHARRLLERDRLRQEVGELVRQLNQKANDPGIYQKLVALGSRYYEKLNLFKKCLRRVKLEKSRISEIVRIIACEETAQQFIAGNISVRLALFLARTTPCQKQPSSTKGENQTAVKQAAKAAKAAKAEQQRAEQLAATLQKLRRLVGKAKHQLPEGWQLQIGLYQLSFEEVPATAEAGAVTCILHRRNFIWKTMEILGSLQPARPRNLAAPD